MGLPMGLRNRCFFASPLFLQVRVSAVRYLMGVLDSAKMLKVFRVALKKCTVGGWSLPDVMQIFLDALRFED